MEQQITWFIQKFILKQKNPCVNFLVNSKSLRAYLKNVGYFPEFHLKNATCIFSTYLLQASYYKR